MAETFVYSSLWFWNINNEVSWAKIKFLLNCFQKIVQFRVKLWSLTSVSGNSSWTSSTLIDQTPWGGLEPLSLTKGFQELTSRTDQPQKVPSGKFSTFWICLLLQSGYWRTTASKQHSAPNYLYIEEECHRGFAPVSPQLLKKLTKLFVFARMRATG